jgi:hypothetical protein
MCLLIAVAADHCRQIRSLLLIAAKIERITLQRRAINKFDPLEFASGSDKTGDPLRSLACFM